MNFDLTSPCALCPFRTDIRPFLRPGRALEFAHNLLDRQGSFPCHKTVDYRHSDGAITDKTQHCAGALILLEKLERPNQLMRVAERLGDYDMRRLDMSAPVFDSFEAMDAAMGGKR